MKVIRPTKKQIEQGNRQAVAALIGIGSLLVPGGAFVGLGKKGIKSAFKKAGSIGNTKKPDTVGNRMRQSQSILGVRKDESGTRIAKHYGSKSPTSYTGGVIGTFKERKIGRTIQKAVEQGPNKFFSSNRSAKTGITPGKRTLSKFDKKTNKRLREYDDMLTGMFEDGQYGSAPFDETSIERMEYEQKRFGKRKSLLKRFKK